MRLGGGSLVSRDISSTVGDKFLISCCGHTVKVHSFATADEVAVLVGHTAEVTSAIPVSSNSASTSASVSHVWSSSLDGTLRLWDYSTSALLRTVHVGHPVESMIIPARSASASRRYAYLSIWFEEKETKARKRTQGRVVAMDLITLKTSPVLLKTRLPRHLTLSPSGGMFGVLDGRRAWVCRTPSSPRHLSSSDWFRLHHTRRLTSLAFNFSETQLAAGDVSGRILIWHGLHPLNPKPQSDTPESPGQGGVRGLDPAEALTTVHWHSQACLSLAFSPDGAHLVSGGHEAVLVMWQLETGARQYLPRLGAPILGITPTSVPSRFLLRCADNSALIVDVAAMGVYRRVQGLKPAATPDLVLSADLAGVSPSGPVLDPSRGCLVVPTAQAGLQVFDLAAGRQLADVQVAPRNFIPRVTAERGPTPSEAPVWVTHVSFSEDGASLATAEVRGPSGGDAGAGFGPWSCLKIWEIATSASPAGKGSTAALLSKESFRVNTLAEKPHGPAVLSSLAFHPASPLLVSCSVPRAGPTLELDTPKGAGEFRVWTKVVGQAGTKDEKELYCWRCRSVAGYRNLPMLFSSFSSDGSLLAICTPECITLWCPVSNEILCVLPSHASCPASLAKFTHRSPYLVTAGVEPPTLGIWNLLSNSLWWSYSLAVHSLAVDPQSDRFAALLTVPGSQKEGPGKLPGTKGSGSGFLVIFSPSSPRVVAAWQVLEGFRGASVLYSKGTGGGGGQVVLLTGDSEYAIFDPLGSSTAGSSATVAVQKKKNVDLEEVSGYEAIYGKVPLGPDVSSSTLSIRSEEKGRPWGKLLDGPSHILPPLNKLCPHFMDAMLQKSLNSN